MESEIEFSRDALTKLLVTNHLWMKRIELVARKIGEMREAPLADWEFKQGILNKMIRGGDCAKTVASFSKYVGRGATDTDRVEFPTACLWDDEALEKEAAAYQEEKRRREAEEKAETVQRQAETERRERAQLEYLKQKYEGSNVDNTAV